MDNEKLKLLPNEPVSGGRKGNGTTKREIVYRGILINLILFFHLFACILVMYTLNQYAYKAFEEINFPNEILNSTNPKSLCDTNTSSDEYKREATIQGDTADWSVYISLASNLPSIFSSSIISALADRFGRKKLLILPLFGTLLRTGLCIPTFHFGWNINYVIAYYFAEGLTGSWVASVALACAYIADITTAGKSRTMAFATLGFSVGIGLSIGTLISGYVIQAYGFLVPVILATGVMLLSVIIVMAFLPESLQEENKVVTINPMHQVKAALDFYMHGNDSPGYGKRWQYIILICAFNFITLSTLGKLNVEIFYQIGSPFCWNPVDVSNFGTIRTAVQEIIGIIALKLLQYCISDEFIAILGTASNLAYFVILGLAQNTFQLYIAAVAGCLGIIQITVIRAIISRMTPAHKQGVAFAGVAVFENICNLVGTVAGGAIYSGTISFWRGFVFIVMAGYNGISIILLFIFYIGSRGNNKGYKEIDVK